MLSIDRAGVRDRALAALEALAPQTQVAPERRALITDYLLGQLPAAVAAQVRERLAQSDAERAWARVVSSELMPLAAGGALPEIPAEAAAQGVPPVQEPEPPTPPAPPAAEEPEPPTPPAPPAAERPEPPTPPAPPAAEEPEPPTPPAPPASQEPETVERPRPEPYQPEPRRPAAAPALAATVQRPQLVSDSAPGGAEKAPNGRPRSRRGGAILLGFGVVVVILVVIIVVSLATGGSSKHNTSSAASHSATSTVSASASTATATSAASSVIPVAQINLKSPDPASKAKGIAEVVRQGSSAGILIVAQGLAPNTKHPPNAYAVWLYNSPADSLRLGFVSPGVTANGKLQTEGGLPANASHYKELILTLETQATLHAPGTIVLQGSLTGV